jgi:hypothetical protein
MHHSDPAVGSDGKEVTEIGLVTQKHRKRATTTQIFSISNVSKLTGREMLNFQPQYLTVSIQPQHPHP